MIYFEVVLHMNNYSITQLLIKHASSNMSTNDINILTQLINQILNSLQQGDSCYIVCDNIDYTAAQAVDILASSNMCHQVSSLNSVLITDPLEQQHKALVLISGTMQLYLSRYYYYEHKILGSIQQLSSYHTPPYTISDSLVDSRQQYNFPNAQQLHAIHQCCSNKFNIITGGPGAGKTTTIALLINELVNKYGDNLQIRLVAPTGKASLRMQQSIANTVSAESQKGNAGLITEHEFFRDLLADNSNFATIHKLLGYRPNSIHFWHNQSNPLNIDVLVVDEASMISLPLFYKLLNAINPETILHIILIGDKNQLSSVEEGCVFQALTTNSHTYFNYTLVQSNRNSGNVAKLAEYIINKQIDHAVAILTDSNEISYYTQLNQLYNNIFDSNMPSYSAYLEQLLSCEYTIEKLIYTLNNFTLLCNSKLGEFGTSSLNQYIDLEIKAALKSSRMWYNGRPIIVLENTSALGIANGDIGIYHYDTNTYEGKIYFANGVALGVSALPRYELAYAITIHKSQGSEYNNVAVVLSNIPQLLNQQLLYTAVTRAKQSVILYASEANIRLAIDNKITRKSGLSNIFS